MKTNGEPTVKIAQLKAKLSHYVRMVRRGGTVIVLDRETPVAKMVPIEEKREALVVRKATGKWEDIKWPPPPKKPVDSLKILMELRRDWM